jgi:hypothetical protein
MLGFKRFDHAAVTTSGIELVQKIKKGQFRTSQVAGCPSHDAGDLGRIAGSLIVNDWATTSNYP